MSSKFTALVEQDPRTAWTVFTLSCALAAPLLAALAPPSPRSLWLAGIWGFVLGATGGAAVMWVWLVR